MSQAIAPTQALPELDIEAVRADFPILSREVNGRQLAYLDSAASAQKPWQVINTITDYYTRYHSNVHRGIHKLAEEATWEYEKARGKVKRLLRANDPREIVFTRGTTESINLVAHSFVRPRVGPGDEILITHMEHHSNIVPWQLVCEATGATLRVVPIDDRGQLELDQLERLLGARTRFLAVVHVSNALGTINPVGDITRLARERNVPILIDGAQAVQHLDVDVQELDCDFYVFSGHKIYGPTGIGALYGRADLLDEMPPYQAGGHMIQSVTLEKSTFARAPHKFEAGTPHIAGAIGMGAAVDYVMRLGLDRIRAHENDVLAHATRVLGEVPGLRMIGTAAEKSSVLSFTLEAAHPHDIATIVDQQGVAVRAGHHCAQPVMDRFGVSATTRASLGVYTTREEIDRLVAALHKVIEVFG